jgi:hypothetical protein
MRRWTPAAALFAVALMSATAFGTPGLGQAPAAAQKSADPWKDFRFLFGEWTGEGKGNPGEGTGTFTFELSLDANVLVRKNHTMFPATKDRPASVHDDLLIVYAEGGEMRGIYFDNEHHVIHYAVSASPGAKAVTFVSDPAANAPRFRFRYTVLDKDRVNNAFEIAPPGKPEAFAPYLEGVSRRVR